MYLVLFGINHGLQKHLDSQNHLDVITSITDLYSETTVTDLFQGALKL